MEDTANKWEFEQNYGKILAMIMVTAVKEIEAQTGRRVITLVIPKPANWEKPDIHTTMQVRLGESVHNSPRSVTRCRYHGNKSSNWFYDWFKRMGTKKPATPEPAGG